MVSICATPIKGTVMRVIKLDVCGNPVTGASGSQIVEAGFLSVKQTPQYEDGQEFTKRRADGALCVNQKDLGQLKRVALETVWCVLDPDIMVLMTGARLITSGGVTGTGAFFNDSLLNTHFSLEVWQEVTGPQACSASGIPQYIYWAWPHVSNAQIQDSTIQYDALEFKINAETKSPGSRWGSLPTTLPPSGYLGGGAFNGVNDHYAYNLTTVAPPAAACGAIALA